MDTKGEQPMLRVPYQKKRNILREITKLLKKGTEGKVKARSVARVAGMCQAVARAVSTAPIYIKNLLRMIPRMESEKWKEKEILLTKEAKMDLLTWADMLANWKGEALVRQLTDMVLETDASDKGWGAFLWDTKKKIWTGKWKTKHINEKELQAVKLAVKRLGRELEGKRILLKIDKRSQWRM